MIIKSQNLNELIYRIWKILKSHSNSEFHFIWYFNSFAESKYELKTRNLNWKIFLKFRKYAEFNKYIKIKNTNEQILKAEGDAELIKGEINTSIEKIQDTLTQIVNRNLKIDKKFPSSE